ncbi:MAG: beta-ketoacyl-ACP synthase II [Spirochaetales bacterium]|nr:beta-ketoacyl-ACP synthase II [Spirochaetales bacterium]
MSRRVVVTGLGTINPLGHSVEETWAAIQASQSGIGRITHIDASTMPCQIAAEVKNFDPSRYIDSKESRKMDPFSQFAAYAALQALEDSGLKVGESIAPERIGTVLGNGIGGVQSLETAYEKIFAGGGPNRIPPMSIPKLISNEAPGNIAILTGAQGPCYSILTACSAGTDAIGDAARWIRDGVADVMITGGTEAAITLMGIGGFCVLKAITFKYNDDPTKSSRPFDKDRSGFVMGEGAGVLILEEYEHAKARGAKIYAELVGYGITCDAYHLTSPHPDGVGAARAMQMALNQAGLKPQDIDYINAHGTSTEINDPTETKAVKIVFGDHAYKLKMSSTKSMTGHCIGATGAIEAIISILALRDQYFPPTINLDNPDIEAGCDLDYVPHHGVKGTIRAVMSNTLGFGGHNSSVIFTKP